MCTVRDVCTFLLPNHSNTFVQNDHDLDQKFCVKVETCTGLIDVKQSVGGSS